jgi:hypothetical protein
MDSTFGREVINTSFKSKREDVWELKEETDRKLQEEAEEWDECDARERLEVALAGKTFPSVEICEDAHAALVKKGWSSSFIPLRKG